MSLQKVKTKTKNSDFLKSAKPDVFSSKTTILQVLYSKNGIRSAQKRKPLKRKTLCRHIPKKQIKQWHIFNTSYAAINHQNWQTFRFQFFENNQKSKPKPKILTFWNPLNRMFLAQKQRFCKFCIPKTVYEAPKNGNHCTLWGIHLLHKHCLISHIYDHHCYIIRECNYMFYFQEIYKLEIFLKKKVRYLLQEKYFTMKTTFWF